MHSAFRQRMETMVSNWRLGNGSRVPQIHPEMAQTHHPREEAADAVASVYDMPMVMWLSMEKKTVCQPNNDGQTIPADGGTWHHHNYYNMPSGFGMQSGDYSCYT